MHRQIEERIDDEDEFGDPVRLQRRHITSRLLLVQGIKLLRTHPPLNNFALTNRDVEISDVGTKPQLDALETRLDSFLPELGPCPYRT